ncbi:hybrid sensor histidine kinase/response regulator transcription factor [Mangrovibacterium diazotrophicum]|uniref:histidine kinase n=1 Tax=Mangrovibacterium diazotrophicum TaxID=1261403 RepID=A0A419VYG0_9BACT|nr:two-component regulator propeller domain-containing protein [Mangrovibacterium diazotrophicum]RKD88275.1 signal transduction histidine kinase [Mangrovibacterium diazotrophicum]
MRSKYLVLFLLLYGVSVLDKVFGSEAIYFENFTVEDGLASNTVLDAAEDSCGRIWFATYNGLSYFDGHYYHSLSDLNFLKEECPANLKPEQLEVDGRGDIWVLFEGGTLARLLNLKGDCQLYPELEFMKGPPIRMEVNKEGTLLIADSIKAWRYEAERDRFQTESVYPEFPGRERLEEIQQHFHAVAPEIEVHAVWEPGNELWISTINSGIFKLNPKDLSILAHYVASDTESNALAGNEVYSLLVDRSGCLWVGTKDHGLSRGYRFSQNFTNIGSEKLELKNAAVRAIVRDDRGELWLGTYNSGLRRLKDGALKTVNFPNSEFARWNWIRSLHIDSSDQVWVGTYAGLVRLNPKNSAVDYFPSKVNGKGILSASRIYGIAEDRSGKFFVGEWGALDYFDPKVGTIQRLDVGTDLEGKNIRKLLLDRQNRLWIGTESDGVFVMNTSTFQIEKNFRFHPSEKHSLASNSIFELCESADGGMWIGTFGGLNRIEPDGQVTSYETLNKELPSTVIYRIFEDDGRLWCSSLKGIVQVDVRDQSLRSYDRTDGVNNPEFSEGAGLMASDGRMYFGGVSGITSFFPDSIPVNPNVPLVNMSGLIVNGENQTLSNVAANENAPVYSFWQNDLQIDLQTILPNSPFRHQLAWRLDPVDDDFQQTYGSKSNLNYAQLPPGDYNLWVKAANSDGVWSDARMLYRFSIEKPFWQEPYYWLGALILVILLGVFLFQRRYTKIRRDNLRLEELVNQRTEKIEKQKSALEDANLALEEQNRKVQLQKDHILAQRDHLLEMYDRQEESNRQKEIFFTNISHDIRTPLSLIYGPAVEMMNDPKTTHFSRNKVQSIYNNAEYIMQLIDQVLDRNKLESAGQKLVLTNGRLLDHCRSVVESFQGRASETGVNLDFAGSGEDFDYRFDYGKLKQVIYNILANSLKFTQTGGQINCRASVEQHNFILTVEDTGIGIPADRIPFIFERYYQIGKSETNGKKGNGIGLSLVKDYVNLLGGTIQVESEEGKGSKFKLEFPLEREVHPEFSLPDLLGVTEGEKDFEQTDETDQVEVLLVEDNPTLQAYLKEIIGQNYRLQVCNNGREGLEYLKKHPHVKAVVTDWIMPEMDGIEMVREIRRKSRFRHLPIVMLTAMSELRNVKEGYLTGVNEFIAKPFDPELLLLKINRLLEQADYKNRQAVIEPIVEPNQPQLESHDEKMIRKLMDVMETEMMNDDLDPQQLADACGVSSMQLYRKLKELMQLTPTEFIRSTRIKRARQLLSDDGIQINEVSHLVGFSDPKYFSRCFQKETGLTPSKFQAKIRRGEQISR